MTDSEIIRDVLSHIDPAFHSVRLVSRNGRTLLALPRDQEAAARALDLYQPQSGAARMLTRGLRLANRLGMGLPFFPQLKPAVHAGPRLPDTPSASQGTCGLLLGSPEHRTRRVIASYRNEDRWEVAKICFGQEGFDILNQEAGILQSLGSRGTGAPPLLDIHHSARMTILRMPYLQGTPIRPGESADAIGLLGSWIGISKPRPIHTFPEWQPIQSALAGFPSGAAATRYLSDIPLLPVIRHGDFARWNLRKRREGGLIVLDWEWGHTDGMPGIDLVHYFLQDARLVARLAPEAALRATIESLGSSECVSYLEKTGWGANPVPLIVACLAWKQGAGHQQNGDALEAALAQMC